MYSSNKVSIGHLHKEPKAQVELAKAVNGNNIHIVEQCLNRCGVKFTDSKVAEQEDSCLRKCFVKVFDSQLLIEKEYERYAIVTDSF